MRPQGPGLRWMRTGALALFWALMANDAAAARLRGFGEVTLSPLAGSGIAGVQFACDSGAHAVLLQHKLARDLAQTSTVPAVWQSVTLSGRAAPVLVRPGLGSYLLATRGTLLLAFTSPRTDELSDAFAGAASMLDGARFVDPDYRYPKYIDKFSHYGIGSWYPPYWGDSITEGNPNSVDDHFAFARQHDLTLQPNSGGFLLRNFLPKIREYDRPFHFAQWHEWSQQLARLCPEELVQPGTLFTSSPSYYGQLSHSSKQLTHYRDWRFQQTVREHIDEPNLVDWLEPHGEIGPFHDHYYWDYSEANRQNFVRWLQTARRYTLQSLGDAWYGDPARLTDWAEVPIPMNYDFFGWQPESIMADRTWRIHSGSLDDGVRTGYHRDQCDDSSWVQFNMPGGELAAMAWRSAKTFWYRGTLNVPGAWLSEQRKGGRIYLNAITLVSSRGWRNPDRLWVNGQELATLFNAPGYQSTGQVDVTDVLRAGSNTISYLPAYGGYGMRGTFFLATKPLETYPFTDTHLNARYVDWHNYVGETLTEEVARTCAAIRAIDPDRPIKVHAAYDKDLMGRVISRFGGYGHNTGEGSFLRAWDKRLGYPRGVGASAEFGGSLTDRVAFERWIGLFTFEGLNAFDNFHNIQAMMYSPVKDLWVKYMPYLKLANRRDIKKPDVALLWSSANNKLLPRNIPYIFDLGRGDLQSIGYSYVYMDELGLEDGLASDYPVLWDCGSWLMSPETVARIKEYVEGGGTFVALQETGRHSFTQRDGWPIAELTGFNVREVRTPLEGAVTILREQPLFTTLAGKTFYNRGKSVDYSDVNFADKCMVLDAAAPGTQAIARYHDGTVAIGMRTLGKGRVIVLGSPFWRDSYDSKGIWWPGDGQCAFLEDLLAGLGQRPLATADSHAVWREHYLANNGTEEYLALWNPTDAVQTVTIDWRTVYPASALVDPKNGQTIPATIDGDRVHLEKLTLAPYETLIAATQTGRAPQESVISWFEHLSWWWRASEPGTVLARPDLPLYEAEVRNGVTSKIVEQAELTAVTMAALSAGADSGPGWGTALGFIRPENLNLTLTATQRIIYRCPVNLPATWQPGDTYELTFKPYWRDHLLVDAWFNGKPVLTVDTPGRKETAVDVSALLAFGQENRLVFSTPATGFLGDIVVVRKPKAAESIDVAGVWQLQATEDSGLSAVDLPGTMTGLYAQKTDVMIPAAWQGSRVFIEIVSADVKEYNSFAINDKMVLHPVAWHAPVSYMDITPWVKFGEANTLTLLPFAAARTWAPGRLTIQRITLQRVPTHQKAK